MQLQNDLTEGNVNKCIISFAVPLIISNLFQALYNAVGMLFVGRYVGTSSLAAVSVSGPITNIIILTTSALSVGVSVVIGKYYGKKEYNKVSQCANTAIIMYLVISLMFTVFGFMFSKVLLEFVNTPSESISEGVVYLKIIFGGSIFMCGYNLISAFQRGIGDSKTPMMLVITAGICNFFLNMLFVKFLGLGVRGSAFATVIAQAISLIFGILYFNINKNYISFSLKTIRVSRELLNELIKMGVPNAMQSLLSNFAFITFTGLANGFGLAASASFGIGIKIDTFAWMPSEAIGSTVAAFTSQNIGAGKTRRAVSGYIESSKLAFIISIITASLVYFFSANLISIFNSDQSVINYGRTYLRIGCFVYIVSTFVHPSIGFIRGTGNSMKTIKNVFISQYLLRIPLGYILARFVGFSALPYATIAGTGLSAAFYLIFIYRRKWVFSKGYKEMRRSINLA